MTFWGRVRETLPLSLGEESLGSFPEGVVVSGARLLSLSSTLTATPVTPTWRPTVSENELVS